MRINSKYINRSLLVVFFIYTAPSIASIMSLTDDFDNESAGLNYNRFANWDVIGGSVDSINSGNYDINCESGNGICLDLDGSSGNAGELVSKESFSPGIYTMQFSFSGHRQPLDGIDSVIVSLGDFTELFEIDSSDTFTTINRIANVDSVGDKLIFSHLGGDNYGAILDNVIVSLSSLPVPDEPESIPVPATFWLFASGFLSLFGTRRRITKSSLILIVPFINNS